MNVEVADAAERRGTGPVVDEAAESEAHRGEEPSGSRTVMAQCRARCERYCTSQ